MKQGKVSEAILKRSVLRQLNLDGAERKLYGADCGLTADGTYTTSVGELPGWEAEPEHQVIAAANNLAAAGAVPEALMMQAILPVNLEENVLRETMKKISAAANKMQMQIIGGHTQVSDAVNRPLYCVTGLGRKKPEIGNPGCAPQKRNPVDREAINSETTGQARLQPGQELILTKWIALGGTAALARIYGEKLRTRYPFSLIDTAAEFEQHFSVMQEAQITAASGRAAMHDLSQGGIFAALWEMAEYGNVGLEVDLKKIPIRQETVEICEFFDVNPYEFYSAGSLLIGTDKSEELLAALAEAGIPAAVIGRATAGKDRIIRNGEDVRHLDRPKQDAWYALHERSNRNTWQS